MTEIQKALYDLRDGAYRDFQSRLLPTVDRERIIGVRTPQLRAMAKAMLREGRAEAFLAQLPHSTFEENQLHAFILADMREFDGCGSEVERFLPYVDNWATCDQLLPKAFAREPQRLIPYIGRWMGSPHPYTVRFAIGMLMKHFLGERFNSAYPERVAALRSGEYYVNMMIAWYFAEALAKQYDEALPYIEQKRLDAWTHNKAIQKARESFRIPQEHKEYLGTLRTR